MTHRGAGGVDSPPSDKSSITESSDMFSAPTMPSSRSRPRRSRDSRTKSSPVGMREEGKLGQRKRNHLDEQWNARFKELLSYRSKHGDSNVPAKQGQLGNWVHKQRGAYKTGSLAQGRIDRLSSIGFQWALLNEEEAAKKWSTRFNELIEYKAEHGDCNVPTKQGKLGNWVRRQRVAYKADSLSQNCIDRLSGIGFKWALLEQSANVSWETRFNELVQYKAKHTDCNVPRSQGPLGRWVSHQRTDCKEGKLSKDRIDRLNSIGFSWKLREAVSAVPWETRFDQLVQYQTKHGDCNVPREQGKLGHWVQSQRGRANSLPQDRINRLNGIGFDWRPGRGGTRKRKAHPSIRKPFSRKERVSSPSNVNSPFVGDIARGAEPNGFKGEGRRATSVPSLKVPPKRSDHSRWTESDDEVDEIGAMIYDQAMRQR